MTQQVPLYLPMTAEFEADTMYNDTFFDFEYDPKVEISSFSAPAPPHILRYQVINPLNVHFYFIDELTSNRTPVPDVRCACAVGGSEVSYCPPMVSGESTDRVFGVNTALGEFQLRKRSFLIGGLVCGQVHPVRDSSGYLVDVNPWKPMDDVLAAAKSSNKHLPAVYFRYALYLFHYRQLQINLFQLFLSVCSGDNDVLLLQHV
ncbi:hypothetical protein J6590_055574 [Homalodisca vitripennis]|nr:hypothetical protein J6590_055574 [Homalodisca vitripennis]